MDINKMINIINGKISGLNTLVIENDSSLHGFTKRILHKYFLYKVEYPEGIRVLLQKFESTDYLILEADVIEFLFDLIISERYKEWENYDLQQENIKWLQKNFLNK
jgi:hypothetical protein